MLKLLKQLRVVYVPFNSTAESCETTIENPPCLILEGVEVEVFRTAVWKTGKAGVAADPVYQGKYSHGFNKPQNF